MSHRNSESLPTTMGRGATAGLVGVVAMTAFQRLVEMPVTGRKESYAPAKLVEKLLPVAPKRRRDRRRLNYAAHLGVGLSWGLGHGLIASRAGLRGQRAVGAVFAALYGGDVVANTAIGLYEPSRWSLQDWGVDVVDKLLLAEVVGLTFDRLRGPGADAQAT